MITLFINAEKLHIKISLGEKHFNYKLGYDFKRFYLKKQHVINKFNYTIFL